MSQTVVEGDTLRPTTDDARLEQSVTAIVDSLWRNELDELISYPSICTGNPAQDTAVTACRNRIIALFTAAGVPAEAWTIAAGGRTATPLVHGRTPPRPDLPTVLLYAHYDVQPVPDHGKGWDTPPFTATDKPDGADVRKYGRGAADDKSGVIMHLATARAFQDTGPPVNLKVLVEGEEETGFGTLEAYLADPASDKSRFRADVVVVADTGNVALGVPTLTTTLRGYAVFDVAVRTLDSAVHSGQYGGPAPDAFMALVRLLADLHTDTGDVAVPGLARDHHRLDPVDPDAFAAAAGVRRGVPLVGTGGLAHRLADHPSLNVIGLHGVDTSDRPGNVLCPAAAARVSVRLAPDEDPEQARRRVEDFLVDRRPWGITPAVTFLGAGPGFTAPTTGPRFAAAKQALATAFATPAVFAGQGGSVPLVRLLQEVNPEAAFVLWGCEEPRARIHGTNESVSKAELTRMSLAQTAFLKNLTQ
ncbi:MAG: M20/M25/M40 family metallo-hydrolase [Saccharothrix sp.]|nr:M20/M25/M40 family metallo-hydrolase [Saccharothrix sp.]